MNIIITGAGKGIGFAIVQELLKSGNHRIVALSRDISKLKELCDEHHTILHAHSFDITQPNLEKALIQLFSSFFNLKKDNGIDILINNAAILINKPFDLLTIQDWEYTFNVNVFGAVKMIRGLYAYFNKENGAHIVNISSMGGFQGAAKFPGLSAYSASKSAIANLTECLAEEWKDNNISVNCLALGGVQTEMLNTAFPGYQAPLKPEEISSFIVDFAINGKKYINGKVLPVSLLEK